MINKLLYILDDHDERQKTNYKSFIEMSKIDTERTKLIHYTNQISIDDLLSNAACVCIHESMPNGIDRNGHGFDFGKLKQELKNKLIPRILFSNSANQLTLLELPLRLSMRSDDFYMNLPPFVQAFQERSIINMELLALGKNYIREKAIRLKREMLTYFDGYARDEFVSMGLDERTKFRELLEQFSTLTQHQSHTDMTFRSLNSGKLTRCLFEQTINSITKFIR